jgi:DNA-binding Lrp family transcriptional regulator
MVAAYVLVSVKPGSEEEIIKKISKIAGVKETHEVYGEYDIIAEVETESLQSLDKLVTKIRNVAGVKYTHTIIVAK